MFHCLTTTEDYNKVRNWTQIESCSHDLATNKPFISLPFKYSPKNIRFYKHIMCLCCWTSHLPAALPGRQGFIKQINWNVSKVRKTQTKQKRTKPHTKPLRLGIFKGNLQKSLLQYDNELKNWNHLTSFTNHEYVSVPLNERTTKTDIVFVQFIKGRQFIRKVFPPLN